MSKKTSSKLSGRAVVDEKGNQRWVWNSEGENIDTAVVRALGEGLTLEGSAPASSTHGSNPYDRADMTPGTRRGRSAARSMTCASSANPLNAPSERQATDEP